MKVQPINGAGNWSLFYTNRYFQTCNHCSLKRILKKFKNCPRCARPIIQENKKDENEKS